MADHLSDGVWLLLLPSHLRAHFSDVVNAKTGSGEKPPNVLGGSTKPIILTAHLTAYLTAFGLSAVNFEPF